MEAPTQVKPNQPTKPVCNNPAWWSLYASTEERQAYMLNQKQAEDERRYRELIRDCDALEDNEVNQ